MVVITIDPHPYRPLGQWNYPRRRPMTAPGPERDLSSWAERVRSAPSFQTLTCSAIERAGGEDLERYSFDCYCDP
jgi:hypothetical protein